jgi:hypothetical protein
VTIKSDQSAPDTVSTPHTAPPSRTTAAAPTARNMAPAENAPLSLTPQAVGTATTSPSRTMALAAPSTTPAVERHAGGGGYFVQVSAHKSQEEAKASFHSMQSRYASVLGGKTPVFRRKDLGSKGVFYGAQVGPLSHEAAIRLCEDLKSAGGSCMVQRN